MDFGCEVNRVEYQRLRWKLSNQNLNFGDHAIGERSISLFERLQLYKTGLSLQNNDIKTFEICDAWLVKNGKKALWYSSLFTR